MSNTLITKKFSSHLVSQFIESINEPANNVYYVTAGKHTPFDDDVVPIPYDRGLETEASFYDELIFGKKITPSDVSHMTVRKNWTSNTVYTPYSDTDIEIYNRDYYVVCDAGSLYYVYKVLDNNFNSASTVNPSLASTSESACNFITTSDGYMWKLMYKMAEEDFEKFATPDYMPVVQSANVAGNTVAGAIDVIKVEHPGSNYVATLNGTFGPLDLRDAIAGGNNTTYRLTSDASANSNFYIGSAIYLTGGTGQGQLRKIVSYNASSRVIVVNSLFTTPPSSDTEYQISPYVSIVGDGSNAEGYAIVSSGNGISNFIQGVVVTNRGAGYTYASASVSGNTGGISNTAIVSPVMPPCGGHGFDAINELGSNYLGISVSFSNNESGYISTDNDYRKISIIKDPLFDNVTLTVDDVYGTFIVGENINQVNTIQLPGTITANTSSATVSGTDTFFDILSPGDKVIIADNINKSYSYKTVSGVANSTSLTLTSNSSLDISAGGIIIKTELLATGIKSGGAFPYIIMDSAEPKFKTGKRVIGESSGAYANVSSIDVNEKSHNNWNTFDNRIRISYTNQSGIVNEDDMMYQVDTAISNAYFHSSNSTYVFLTRDRGPINADPLTLLYNETGSGSFSLGSVKYNPDIKKGSGKVIYIENTDPIARSITQSENIKIILKF